MATFDRFLEEDSDVTLRARYGADIPRNPLAPGVTEPERLAPRGGSAGDQRSLGSGPHTPLAAGARGPRSVATPGLLIRLVYAGGAALVLAFAMGALCGALLVLGSW